jgi:CheY-like chemotaxis protein
VLPENDTVKVAEFKPEIAREAKNEIRNLKDRTPRLKNACQPPRPACLGVLAGVYSVRIMSEPVVSDVDSGVQQLIYVVDDEPMLLELASVILAPLGYKIRTFRDPESALAAFTAARPRPVLIITDYSMHKLNGLALLEGCRKLEPRQKGLLVSGTVGPEVFRRSRVKPDWFLANPYAAQQLVDLVKQILVT